MSKKRQERKQRQKERTEEATKRETVAAAPVNHETLGEANSALAETSRVIDMKKAAEKVKAKIPIGGVKKSHQGKPPTWAAGNPKLPPASKLPSLPRTRLPKAKPLVDCVCGCGGKTKGQYVPGHDSYLRALVMRVERDVMSLDEVAEMVGPGQRAAVERILKEKKAEARKAVKEGKVEAPAGVKSSKTKTAAPIAEDAEAEDVDTEDTDAEVDEGEMEVATKTKG